MTNNNVLFRCSALGKIMTDPKTNAAKAAGELSETAKTFIQELWLRENYGYYEEVITSQMFKGILCESDSIGIAHKVLGGSEFRLKNNKNFANDFIKGTPDIILSDTIEDVKTSWTVKTYFDAELTKDYFWQLVGYMLLTGRKKARLIYCMVNTPDEIITELKKRVWFTFNCQEDNPDYIRISQQIEKNHNFDNIPIEKRVKKFEFEFQPEFEQMLYAKIEQARIYYNQINL